MHCRVGLMGILWCLCVIWCLSVLCFSGFYLTSYGDVYVYPHTFFKFHSRITCSKKYCTWGNLPSLASLSCKLQITVLHWAFTFPISWLHSSRIRWITNWAKLLLYTLEGNMTYRGRDFSPRSSLNYSSNNFFIECVTSGKWKLSLTRKLNVLRTISYLLQYQ